MHDREGGRRCPLRGGGPSLFFSAAPAGGPDLPVAAA